MNRLHARSLRGRLTLWYCCVLAVIALVLAGASRWALSVSLDHALDQSLRYRLIGLHGFIDNNSHEGLDELAGRLRELNTLGELFQVFGPGGELLAQSNGLARHHVRSRPPSNAGPGMLFRRTGPPWFPVRMATQEIFVAGHPLIIEVADPERKFDGVLKEFYSALCLALPFVLALAAFGGHWLSGRALAPVDQIIDEARAIDPANLSARLSVPVSGDELQRLSETLNQMLGRVEQSVLQMRRFTADASHELRAPMTLIYTAAQFALRRERSTADLVDALQKILREARRSTDLINQLLWLARSDAGGNTLPLASVEVVELLREVFSEISPLAASNDLNLSAALPQPPVHLDIDASSFRRLLLILLDNAIKYTSPGGTATLSLSLDQGTVAIAVADTGTGIPADQLPLIFDRFWRADKVRSRDTGGTGLGLAIARDIAQSHGAALTVASSPGLGSTFTIRMPRSVESSIKPAQTEQLA